MELGNVYFFTGFPGFISNRLLAKLLERKEAPEAIYALVLPEMTEKAESQRQNLLKMTGFPGEKFLVITGDITRKGLGIDPDVQEKLAETVTHVFHLAAIYDLAVPKDIAYKVNVEGTRNVNDWVRGLKSLRRYVYFSTAYVAGKREGVLYEHELVRPPAFKNYYEETKYEAEVLVDALKREVPLTIIRPGIVKGHSQTGETSKFDGPYFILNLIDRLRFLPIFPGIGNTEAVVNLVPVDFIVDAVLYLSHAKTGEGKTYHLTDPRPYKVREVYAMILKEMLGKTPKGRIPLPVLRAALSVPLIRRWLRTEKEVTDYFTWMGNFDSSQAQKDLGEAGIRCPDLKTQIPAMVKFYLENKNNEQYQLNIR